MIDAAYDYLLGLALGLSLAVPPGPMNALIAAEALKTPLHGTAVGAGAMSADATLMVVTYFLYGLVKPYVSYVYFIGGGVMMYLAVLMLRPSRTVANAHGLGNVLRNYTKGYVMGITNPYQIGWWLSAGLTLISIMGVFSIAGLFTGILTWIIAYPLAVYAGKRYLGGKYEVIVKAASGIAIMGFALYFMYIGLTLLFRGILP
ncbi:LysE family transporter [Caldivirga sp. UBA161]|uniref:LysE family transporter n=1 Tax=Caldivirga sp. UBA161 TaxID=1915569 RepID=UPI0025BF942D|nr:LysE family transporter [Caldivirga sp. UBA161]